MVAERLARAVREQVGLGRLLPLGGPGDGVWLAESAAAGVLRAAGDAVPGVRLDRLRIGPAQPGGAADPDGGAEAAGGSGAAADDAVRPPSALPPGPLSVTGEFAATPDAPLPERAAALRAVLADAAADRLGFRPAGIDLLVSGLLEEPPGTDGPDHDGARAPGGERSSGAGPDGEPSSGDGGPDGEPSSGDGRGTAGAVAAAVLAVPGVARLAPVLGGAPRGVRMTGGAVQLQLAVDATAGPVLETARAARRAAADAAGTDRVAVVVTAVT